MSKASTTLLNKVVRHRCHAWVVARLSLGMFPSLSLLNLKGEF